jgi:adenosine deaminase
MEDVETALRAMPKVQVHCHLEGTVRAETFRELAARSAIESVRASGPFEATYRFATFREFLLTFAEVCKTLRTPEDYARIARDYVVDAASQNVRYAEVFVSPSVWTFFHPDLDVRATFEALREAFDAEGAARGLRVGLIVDLTRNFGVERAFATARTAVAMRDLGVIGVGLGGDEANYPPELYAEPFAYARANGLHTVAHAGEAAGPESVRGALDALGAERIGHGVRSIEDPHLVDDLARRSIPLELCPTSNRLTGAAPADRPHPVGELDRAGCVCTIDADDPALFSTTLVEEYALVERQLGYGAVVRLAGNAIDASFAEPSLKADLRRELAAFDLETSGARRMS